jgi:hypothetical protein
MVKHLHGMLHYTLLKAKLLQDPVKKILDQRLKETHIEIENNKMCT